MNQEQLQAMDYDEKVAYILENTNLYRYQVIEFSSAVIDYMISSISEKEQTK